jgi:glycosyltransferase involved in cell wall biosynthesis
VIITSTRATLGYLPRAAWWIDRWTSRLGSRIVAVSRGTAAFITDVERIPAERVRIIPNGVDLGRFTPRDQAESRAALGVPPRARVLAVVGRLAAQKGHTVLLRSLTRLPDRGNLVCLIAGDGPLRGALEREASEYGLNGVCRFLGAVPDPRTVYAAADLTVLPSFFEGMPNVLLEAMAMGCPAVATDVAGSQELVHPGVTGFLVPAGKVDALAEGITRALATFGAETRAAIRRHAESAHGIDRMIGRVEQLYTEELAGAGR